MGRRVPALRPLRIRENAKKWAGCADVGGGGGGGLGNRAVVGRYCGAGRGDGERLGRRVVRGVVVRGGGVRVGAYLRKLLRGGGRRWRGGVALHVPVCRGEARGDDGVGRQ